MSTERRVIVRPGDAASLGAILPRLGEGAERALAEGRVFVGKKRATDVRHPIVAGDEVVLYPPRAKRDEPTLLADEDGIIAAYKPAALATVADHRGRAGSLVAEVERLVGAGPLHATSRLDVGVSGVVLFARTPEAAARLADARERGLYRRHYVALAARAPSPDRGRWSAPIGRGKDARHRRVGGPDAVPAQTDYFVAKVAPRGEALLGVEPATGRTHQIRVHAAHAHAPLLGDAAYGGPTRLTASSGAVTRLERIALHAAWVEVPTSSAAPLRVRAALPDDLTHIWRLLGGDDGAWDDAREQC